MSQARAGTVPPRNEPAASRTSGLPLEPVSRPSPCPLLPAPTTYRRLLSTATTRLAVARGASALSRDADTRGNPFAHETRTPAIQKRSASRHTPDEDERRAPGGDSNSQPSGVPGPESLTWDDSGFPSLPVAPS